MGTKVKCFSVRLKSLVSISEKAYKATSFDGTTAIIPKSQVFGQDYDVQKSDAYWISSWILGQKELQYSTKKESWFEKELSHVSGEGVEIERHIPEEKEPVEVEPIAELVKEQEWKGLFLSSLPDLLGKVIIWSAPAYKGNEGYFGYGKYGGKERIDKISINESRPIITTTKMDPESDDLTFASNNNNEGLLSYSDSDRYVTYKLYIE